MILGILATMTGACLPSMSCKALSIIAAITRRQHFPIRCSYVTGRLLRSHSGSTARGQFQLADGLIDSSRKSLYSNYVRAVRGGSCRAMRRCIDGNDCAEGYECVEGVCVADAGRSPRARRRPVCGSRHVASAADMRLRAPCILTRTTACCGPSAMILPHVRWRVHARCRVPGSRRQFLDITCRYRQCGQGICLRDAAGREPAECNDVCLPVFGDRLRFADHAVADVLFPGSNQGCPAGNHGRSVCGSGYVAGIVDLSIKSLCA